MGNILGHRQSPSIGHRQSGSFRGPANRTRQTNQLHRPTTNISTSSNVMTTPNHNSSYRSKMSEEDSSRSYPPVNPSLAGLSHNRDLITIDSTNPMPTPMPSQGSTNPTLQTNPLKYPAQNTSASANAKPTPMPSQGSTNPTMQTNPLQYPAQNTSASANAKPTPTPRGNPPLHSNLGSLGGPANPPMQTNPLQYPAPNTSTNFMTTPIHKGNSPALSHSDSLDGQAKLTRQPNPLQVQTYQHHPVPVVAIGNPGSGKSTILNSLAGQVLFGSGISLGCGLTNQLEIKEANGRKFIDTPGVADDTYRQAAGEALKKVFHDGGRMKVLFFITQEAGRILSQDVTTMKLVLESVPEIGRNYGVIVNKIQKNVLFQLSHEETYLKFFLSLNAGIKADFKNLHVLLVPLNDKLSNIDNAILHPSDIHQNLLNFINTNIPDAYITPGKITEIRVNDFEKMNEQVQNLQSELKNNKERLTAETAKLQTEFANIDKEKTKQRDEELQKLKKDIRDKEEKIKTFQQRSENDKIMEEMKKMKKEMNNQLNQMKMLKEESKQKKAKPYNNDKAWNLLYKLLKEGRQDAEGAVAHEAELGQDGT